MKSEREEPQDVEELDLEEAEELESAIREALEAVEGSGRQEVEEGRAGSVDSGVGDGLETPEELAMLRREVAELRDRSIRTLADFDNFRKRAERERQEQLRYAGSEVLRDLLGVVDNLERALGVEGDTDDLRAGVELILRQLLDLLRRNGVERVEAQGRAFDPGVHEAVSRVEDAEVPVPTVSEEMQSGYLMKDRLLRPAMVVVAVPTPSNGEAEADD